MPLPTPMPSGLVSLAIASCSGLYMPQQKSYKIQRHLPSGVFSRQYLMLPRSVLLDQISAMHQSAKFSTSTQSVMVLYTSGSLMLASLLVT